MPELKIRDWNKIVADSNGTMIFLPSQFQKRAEDWEKKRTEYNKKVAEMAELQMTVNNLVSTLLFDVRKYLRDNGREDVFLKDMGFEDNALIDKKFILNFYEPRKGNLPLE